MPGLLGWMLTITAHAADADADGFDAAVDCDDADPTIHPGAAEVCGGADEDCDGLVDDLDPSVTGRPTWYADLDLDLHGDPARSVRRCVAPASTVAVGDDCDDTRAGVHPGATERCDATNRDDDCDGLADDADSPVTGKKRWYEDLDGDGVGSLVELGRSCDAPPGGVGTHRDCDDADPTASENQSWYPDLDADGYVDQAGGFVDCGSPGPGYVGILTASDCDDARNDVHPGTVDECDDGLDRDCSGFDAVCPWWDEQVAGLAVGAGFGSDVEAGADATGDGLPDVAVVDASHVYLFQVPVPADPGSAVLALTGGGFGADDVALGDTDGDGRAELLLGDSAYLNATGQAFLVAGTTVGSHAPATVATTRFVGTGGNTLHGQRVALGDTNGDGLDDALVAAPLKNLGGNQTGSVLLVEAPLPAMVNLSLAATTEIYGDAPSRQIADQELFAGDLDADGDDDVVFASDSGSTNRVYLFRTLPAGAVVASAADAVLTAPTVGGYATGGFATGDVDGDGAPDLATSIDDLAFEVVVVPGSTGSGTATAVASTRVRDLADEVSHALRARNAIADLDGDGQDDLAIGVPYATVGEVDGGAVWLFRGPLAAGSLDLATADRALIGGSAGEQVGGAVAADLDLDGVDDLVVGGTSFGSYTTPGQAFVVYAPL